MVLSRPLSAASLVLALGSLLALPLRGAPPAVTPAPTPRPGPLVRNVDVTVTNVDVVVTDSKGRRVKGLTRDDFEIYEDGMLQPLTNFYAVDGGKVVFFGDEAVPGASATPAVPEATGPAATPAPAPTPPQPAEDASVAP